MADLQWFILALVGPFLYAATNHIDKHLLEEYFEENGVWILILYSSILSALALPIIYWVDGTVMSVDGKSVVILTFVAILDVILLWAYLSALSEDEPTVVIIFYQLVPVLGLLFGYLLLGETITTTQGLAMLVVIIGATLISFEVDEERSLRWKKRTLMFMLIACTCWALETTTFKLVAINEDENVLRSLFWEHLVLAVIGFGIFTLLPTYRRTFLKAFRLNSKSVFSLNVFNEGLYMLGNVAVAYASMMAPVALTLLMNAYQPIFVLVLGIAIAILIPSLSTENVSRGAVVQKLAATFLTGVGTYILLS